MSWLKLEGKLDELDELYCKLDELAKLYCKFDELAKLRICSISLVSCTVSSMS